MQRSGMFWCIITRVDSSNYVFLFSGCGRARRHLSPRSCECVQAQCCNHVKLTARNVFDGGIGIDISVPKSLSFALYFLYDYYQSFKYVSKWKIQIESECCFPQKHPVAQKLCNEFTQISRITECDPVEIRFRYERHACIVGTTQNVYITH